MAAAGTQKEITMPGITPGATPDITPGVIWVRSSLSFSNGNCVEVADVGAGAVGVRDSKDPEGPVLRFTPGEWRAFIGGARNGEFDQFG